MNFLIVGSGAREHALAKALHRSSQRPSIFCCGTSSNPGILQLANGYQVSDICNVEEISGIARDWNIDIAIIGPEAPLEKGLANALWEKGIPTLGPTQQLAQIETSKTFTRDLLNKYHIAGSLIYRAFKDLSGVKAFLQELGEGNYVIKANGLMGGKGVKVAGDHLHSFEEAYQFCQEIIAANQSFVIEEKLIGQEFSLLCFCDGKTLVAMPAVQDHKRLLDGDKGPNTGGMGSYSDANHSLPFLKESDLVEAQKINEAVIKALTAECNEKYRGFLYGSFMITKDGVRLIEYNARLGDPEAMNVLAVLESDFVTLCQAIVSEKLTPELVRFANLATVCKYAVPEGYPNKSKNFIIDFSKVKHPEQLYFASVNSLKGETILTGGRAVAIVGVAKTIEEAEKKAEADIKNIEGPLFHRSDIGTAQLIEQRVKQMQELRSCSV